MRSLVNARSLLLECARVLHESLLVPVLTYGCEIIRSNPNRQNSKVLYRWGGSGEEERQANTEK